MPRSNFPNGFANGVDIQSLPINVNISSKSNVFWVASSTMTGYGVSPSDGNSGSPQAPFATLSYAISRCKDNHGDVIYVAPGHTETVSAAAGLVFDVIGVTVIFMGEGTDQAKIRFTTTDAADVDIDAANVTLINPVFQCSIDGILGAIDVNAVDFTIVNGIFKDSTDISAIDCIVADAGATRMRIFGWTYYKANEGGTQKQSHIQLNGTDDVILKDIDVIGNYATSIIENITDEVLDIRFENIKLNNTNVGPTPCIILDPSSTGWAKNIDLRVASGTTYIDDLANLNYDPKCYGYSTDGEGGEPIGTASSTGLEGKIDIIDAYHDVPTADTADNVVTSDVVGNKTDTVAGTSLVSLVKVADAAIDVVDAYHDVPTADTADNTVMSDVLGNKTDTVGGDSVVALAKINAAAIAVVDAFHDVPTADSADNVVVSDVLGNKTDTVAGDSVVALIKVADAAVDLIATDVTAILADTDTISGITLPVDPVANSLAAFIASGGTALGTELADSKSIVDCYGTDGTTVTDSAVTILGAVGADNASNAFASTAIVADADGSVLERQEYGQDQLALILADSDTISGAALPAAPTASSLAAFIASGGTALGTELADSKSIVDALGSDGTTLGYGSGSILGAVGTYVVVTKQLISSNILQDGVGTVDVTGVSSGGDLILESVTFNTDGTGLAAGTNFQLEISGNGFGATGAVVAEAVASMGANVTIAAKDASVTPLSGAVVESGAKIVATSTAAACTGGGIVEMQLVFRRVTAGAIIAAA